MENNYILVTPCKNEEENIDRLVQSVKNQSIKPKLWVIINDGSTDNTEKLIRKYRYKWIKLVNLKEHKREIGIHLAKVCKLALDSAIKLARRRKLTFSYIGLLDADMHIGKNYFANLIREMQKDNVGIGSGVIYSKNKVGNYKREYHKENLPRGGARLWNFQCYLETGGMRITYSPDSVSNAAAKIKGWKLRQYEQIIAYQVRETSSAEGIWKGYKIEGISSYYRDYHPLYIVAKSFLLIFKKPGLAGVAFFSGYINGYLSRIGKLRDSKIRKYYRYTKMKEIFVN